MHFVGMLALRLPFPVDYLVFPTLLSFLVCVIVVGAAVFLASVGAVSPIRLAAAAMFMGSGIAAMHYVGMTALHASAHMTHAPAFVVASVAVAIAAAGLALWLAAGRGGRPPLVLSAAALGCAIAGMHYTAMAGLTLVPLPTPAIEAPALSTDLLAIVVAVVAFLVSGIFLLTLVPDRSEPAAADTAPAMVPTTPAARGIAAGHAGFSPLGGAGQPPHRAARHLPVEQEGATRQVAVDDIVAIHANAHYAYIFDGKAQLFCPLAIGDIEARLDAQRFVRVHRSHIVNLGHVVALKRAGENGLVELTGIDRPTVPVSRSRLRSLRSRLPAALSARLGEDPAAG